MDINRARVVSRSVGHALVKMTALPNLEMALQSKGKTALHQLNRLLQRDFRRRRDQRVDMVRHDHKSMQRKSPLFAIVAKRLRHQFRLRLDLEKSPSTRCREGGEI